MAPNRSVLQNLRRRKDMAVVLLSGVITAERSKNFVQNRNSLSADRHLAQGIFSFSFFLF